MVQQRGHGHGASEGGEVRCNVVDRGDKSLVHDVGDSDEKTARESRGQKETHHGRSLAADPLPTQVTHHPLRSVLKPPYARAGGIADLVSR